LVVPAWLIGRYRAAKEETGTHVTATSEIRRAPGDAVVIGLAVDVQRRIGLQTASPEPGTMARELKAYGRVLDPAPLVSLLAEIATARAALEASKKELDRVTLLHEQGENASRRAVEAAEAALRRDQVAFEAARLRLVSGWGKAMAERPDHPAFVESLATHQAFLVRLDLPAGEACSTPQGARLYALDSPDKSTAAEYLGPAADVDPRAQGLGFLFHVKDGNAGLRPGQALVGFIQQPGEPVKGVVAPASAVVRAGGRAWVYLQTSETSFARRELALDYPTGGGWLVTGGLTTNDRIVVTGAQLLCSEELKSRIQFRD
jgi:hypothetical protein